MRNIISILTIILTPICIFGANPVVKIVEKYPWYGGWGVEYVEITYMGESTILYPDHEIDEDIKLTPINSNTFWNALVALREEATLICDSIQIQDNNLVSKVLEMPSSPNALMTIFLNSKNIFLRVYLNNGQQILLFPKDSNKSKHWLIIWKNSIFEVSSDAVIRFKKNAKQVEPS